MNARDEDGADDAELRALLRGAVEAVSPTPDLEGVLAGARRGATADREATTTEEPSRVRRPLIALAAAAGAVATIVGVGVGADVLFPAPTPPPSTDAATAGPVPDADRLTSRDDPFAPVRTDEGGDGRQRWLVPVYRMRLGASPDGFEPRAYPLVGTLTAVDSEGDSEQLLTAALTADLPGGVADYGTTVLAGLRVGGVQEESGTQTVSLVAEGLSADVPDRARLRDAALQQAAWTARSVLGGEVRLRVELEDQGETVDVAPDPAALDTFQIARPVIGTTFGTDEEVRLTGTTPADTTSLTYELFRSTAVPGGAQLELVDSGDVAYGEVRADLGGRRAYDVVIPRPQQPGTYELSVGYFGTGSFGQQDLRHTFEIVDGASTSEETP